MRGIKWIKKYNFTLEKEIIVIWTLTIFYCIYSCFIFYRFDSVVNDSFYRKERIDNRAHKYLQDKTGDIFRKLGFPNPGDKNYLEFKKEKEKLNDKYKRGYFDYIKLDEFFDCGIDE